MRKCLLCIVAVVVSIAALGQEIKGKYTGTVLLAKINDSRVNVRDFPSLNAKKVGQLNNGDLIAVTGVSENSDQIEGVSSHWLRVQLVTGSYEYGDPLGWVFGKYVEKGAVLQPALLRYGDFIPATDRKVALLRISFEVDGQKKEAVVRPKKIEGQDFYSFAWNDDGQDYEYRTIPGSYAWFPGSNEIRHISYYGDTVESAWVAFTDDFKFEFEDFGTSPGPRGLTVWNLEKRVKIFSGSYYGGLKLRDHSVEGVYQYDDWRIKNGLIDKEIDAYARDFMKNNPSPKPRDDGLSTTLIIICDLDLNTNKLYDRS